MKKILSFVKRISAVLFVIFALTPTLASANQNPDADGKKGYRALIVYYSWSNNVRAMAEVIQRRTGFDMEELKVVTPYIGPYEVLLEQVREEERRGYLPPLKPLKADLASYDVVFVGAPLWIYTLSSPGMSFLTNNDLSGKTVIPFAARGTSSPDRLYAKFNELCAGCRVMKGFDIPRGGFNRAEPMFTQWIDDTVKALENRDF